MTKEELALEIIQRLKKNIRTQDVPLDYNQAWKLLSVSAWLPSVRMPGLMWWLGPV